MGQPATPATVATDKKVKMSESNPTFKGWPILILWPADTPEVVLPHVADWRRLEDKTIEAAYYSEPELRESIHVLAMVKEAQALGGVVRN
jgi:hypothetical protein